VGALPDPRCLPFAPRAAGHNRSMMTTSTPQGEPLRTVGGYRVIRQLAAGQRDITLLLHDDAHLLVARVLAAGFSPEELDREVAVSDVVHSAGDPLRSHVQTVRDLCTIDDGRLALITEHLGGPRLDRLLHDRHGDVGLGEAVTLLAPLATAVDEGHRVGITGLPVDAASVRLRVSGAPVFTRAGGAALGPAVPERFRHREPAYAADHDRLAQIATAVADALTADDQPALLALLSRQAGRLDHALFALAEPLPVRVTRVNTSSTSSTRRTPDLDLADTPRAAEPVETLAGSIPAAAFEERGRHAADVLEMLDSLGLPPAVIATARAAVVSVTERVERLVAAVGRVVRAPGTVRVRYRRAGLAGAGALVVAVVVALLPGGNSGEIGHRDSADIDDAKPFGEQAVAEAFVGAPETELHPEPESWSSIVKELVTRWVDCAPKRAAVAAEAGGREESLSALPRCVAHTAHHDSAASDLIGVHDDRHRVLQAWLAEQGGVVVVEQMGSAVLIDLLTAETTAASLLLVRSEAGWRIRDVIA